LVGDKNNQEYYEESKRKLFKHNFISQNIIYQNLVKNKEVEVINLVYQILSKYGMHPFKVELNTNYDYVIGVDVGNNRYGKRNIAGGISVVNKEGILEKLIPIEVLTGGENIDLSLFLEEISRYINLKNKKILLLRDGKLTDKEIQSAKEEINNLNLEVTFINIIKNHNLRFFSTTSNKGVIFQNLSLLLPHSHKAAKPIKMDKKVKITNSISYLPITKEDLELIYKLTFINYSNPFKENLRLPAPIHYSDKFVKALGKEWRVDKELLTKGFLYFI
jgi:argonaute family protein